MGWRLTDWTRKQKNQSEKKIRNLGKLGHCPLGAAQWGHRRYQSTGSMAPGALALGWTTHWGREKGSLTGKGAQILGVQKRNEFPGSFHTILCLTKDTQSVNL